MYSKEDLFFSPIPGIKLRKFLESFVIFTGGAMLHPDFAKNVPDEPEKDEKGEYKDKKAGDHFTSKMGMALIQTLTKWPDKAEAESLFFEHTSLTGYGKLSSPKTQNEIWDNIGGMVLTNIYADCWMHYLGEQLSGPADKENTKEPTTGTENQ